MTDDFAEWIRRNPPPDLQALIKQYGSFSAITPEAWKRYDDAMLAWKISYRARGAWISKTRGNEA